MNFRKSTFDDVDRILEIIEKAKIELRKLGLEQWQNGYPDREVIENDIKSGISYVLEDIEKNGFSYCGVIYLDKEPDVGEKRIAYEKIIKIPHKLF